MIPLQRRLKNWQRGSERIARRRHRREQFKRFDEFLVRFNNEAPMLFWLFSMAIGAVFFLVVDIVGEWLLRVLRPH